jgi:hypothetical protein
VKSLARGRRWRRLQGLSTSKIPLIWQFRMAGEKRPLASSEEFSHKIIRGIVNVG